MKLKKILDGVEVLYAEGSKNIDINKICISTNEVTAGSLYIALKGLKHDGHNFLQQAESMGAKAFIVEKYVDGLNVPQVIVKDTRKALSIIASNFYKYKNKMKIIGITGTNGKTTTTYMLKNILECAGKKVAIIGTEGIYYGGQKINLNMTTPDPIDLFKYLKLMADSGVQYVVMEVSAHAIFLNKISPIKFYAKALTNITEDHLDFFITMENYAKVKMDYINSQECIKVVNNDDPMGLKLSQDNKKIFSFAIDEKADVFAYDLSRDGSRYAVSMFDKNLDINARVLGRYNIENALCAISLASLMGIKEKYITTGINTFQSVAGRMNIYKNGGKRAIVDFAHTPDAMQKLFTTIRPFTNGRLICVFGCGGNRDAQKRGIMGNIATLLCDKVYITNDNPRYENPEDIAKDIVGGITTNNYEIILNRKEAIKMATQEMQDGDVLVLCGKGAESYIEIKGQKCEYSEKQELEKCGFFSGETEK